MLAKCNPDDNDNDDPDHNMLIRHLRKTICCAPVAMAPAPDATVAPIANEALRMSIHLFTSAHVYLFTSVHVHSHFG